MIRKVFFLLFALILGCGIYATRNIDSETGRPVHEKLTPVSTHDYSAHDGDYSIDVWEDGSGVLYEKDADVHHFDADFFPWDCTSNGNNECGPTATDEVRGYKCITWVYDDIAMHYCTDGSFKTWLATDEDVEGEVIPD